MEADLSKQSVLVIGGAGYIGSHMVRTLLEANCRPVVFDNLSTGHRSSVPEKVPLEEGDLQNAEEVEGLFKKYSFDAVMHFAASSIVSESVRDPLKYYRNNTAAFLNLLEQMQKQGVPKLIFSSTAAVYGEPLESPIHEKCPSSPVNPYGHSKAMMERILADFALNRLVSYVIFRYFNAAGAHGCGEIGESHCPETHLIPNLLASMDQGTEFTVFGGDYPTRDGTCIRDYVHVEDLCRAHLSALQYLKRGGGNEIFNLGTQEGYSVLEVVHAAEKITGKEAKVKIGRRRPGDPAELIADSQKAGKILGWKPELDLNSIVHSAWKWNQKCGGKNQTEIFAGSK